MKIFDTIERALFGATAAERVDMMAELAAQRAEARLIAALDRAFDGAIADTFGDESSENTGGND